MNCSAQTQTKLWRLLYVLHWKYVSHRQKIMRSRRDVICVCERERAIHGHQSNGKLANWNFTFYFMWFLAWFSFCFCFFVFFYLMNKSISRFHWFIRPVLMWLHCYFIIWYAKHLGFVSADEAVPRQRKRYHYNSLHTLAQQI